MRQNQSQARLLFLKLYWADVVTLAAGLLVMTFGLGGYGFYEPHEGHFGGVAREMLLRGDWVTPTLNGAPYLNKPPLLYWLIASSTALLGFTEFAARLPVAIAGWVGVIIAWKWARELWNPAAGRAAALMLCVTTGWFMFAHQILIDILLSTLLLATYYCLWRLVWESHRWRYFFALYVLVGLCLLAKGPFVLIFLALGCLSLARSRHSWGVIRKVRLPLGAGITLAIVLPWTIAVETANPGFWHYFLFNENLNRIADTRWPPDYDVSKVSVWGYLAVTAIWCAPWTLLLPQVVRSAWRDCQQGLQRNGEENAVGAIPPRSPQNGGEWESQRRGEGVLLLAVAAVLPMLLFLPLASRLVYYSLPSIAPFVILCAGWWSRCGDKLQQSGRIAAGMAFSLLGLAIASAAIWAPSRVMELPELSHAPKMGAMIMPIALVTGLGMLLGGFWLLAKRPNLALIALFIGLACANGAIANGFVAVQDFRSAKTLVETANPRLILTTLWTFEGSRELGPASAISYYLDRDGKIPPSKIQNPLAQRRVALSKIQNPKSKIQNLPPGWAKGKPGTIYRVVMVLTDGGPNRIPPAFPGSQPGYAMTKRELQAYWESDRPVVFVTDFMRQPNDPLDPPNLNLPRNAGDPLLAIGPRKLYGNVAARKFWLKSQGVGGRQLESHQSIN